MKWERFSCLQEKEVINICDGRPWRCIRRIGDDIILVEVDGEEILRTDGD